MTYKLNANICRRKLEIMSKNNLRNKMHLRRKGLCLFSWSLAHSSPKHCSPGVILLTVFWPPLPSVVRNSFFLVNRSNDWVSASPYSLLLLSLLYFLFIPVSRLVCSSRVRGGPQPKRSRQTPSWCRHQRLKSTCSCVWWWPGLGQITPIWQKDIPFPGYFCYECKFLYRILRLFVSKTCS